VYSLNFRLLLVVFAALAGGASFLQANHYFPWPAFYSEYLAFVAFFFISLGSLVRSGLVFSRTVLCVFFVALIPLLQFACGVVFFFGDALLACLYLLGFAVALVVGQSVTAGDGRGLIFSAWVLLWVAMFSTWVALCQWLLVAEKFQLFLVLPVGARPYAHLGQSNNLATMLVMALVALLYLYEKSKLGIWGAVSLAVFLLLGVALTQSRTPWVAGFAVLLFWVFRASKCGARVSWRGLLGWYLLYIIFVAFLPYLANKLLLVSSDPLQRVQSLHRWELWWQLIHAALQGPLWGYGWNQVSVAQVAVSLTYPIQLMTEHSHNVLLDLLLWNGPLLGGLIIAYMVVWLGRLAWCVRTVESLCSLLVVGIVLTHGMVEFPLEYAFFLLPTGLLLGVVMAEHSAGFRWVVPRYMALGVVLILGGLLGWVWREYRVVEEDHRLMRFESAGIGLLRAEQAAPDALLLTQLREFIRYARTPAVEGMNVEQLYWMEKVAHRYPYPSSLIRYSLALALNGRPEEAYEQLRILRALHGIERYDAAVQDFLLARDKYPYLQELTDLFLMVPVQLNP
jgi:hypothetical protein